MWFSSGGTSSVVHTDAVENLNCLIAGTKRFTFVPPEYKVCKIFMFYMLQYTIGDNLQNEVNWSVHEL